jgi:hypothetical protein
MGYGSGPSAWAVAAGADLASAMRPHRSIWRYTTDATETLFRKVMKIDAISPNFSFHPSVATSASTSCGKGRGGRRATAPRKGDPHRRPGSGCDHLVCWQWASIFLPFDGWHTGSTFDAAIVLRWRPPIKPYQ